MKKSQDFFYKKGVDISSIKQMFYFIKDHFTYYTLNSWNGLYSIANNVKVYKLDLEGSWSTALNLLYDDLDTYGVQDALAQMIVDFEDKHHGYCVYFNGRSDGYLVLGNTQNMRGVIPPEIMECDTYDEFKQYCYDHYGVPLEESIFWDLRNATIIIREFDRLCDRMREVLNNAIKEAEAKE